MNKEKICGIYKITNLVNGKMYIGQSVDIYRRWNDHKYSAFKKYNNVIYNVILYRAIRKYGLENFEFEIIEECSVDELNEKEIYYINKYNTFVHNKNSCGYNMTLGGEGVKGSKLSEETKNKVSKSRKGKCKGKENKISKAVICDGIYFDCITDCANYYGESNLKNWLNGINRIPQKYYDLKLHYADRKFEDHNYIIKHGYFKEGHIAKGKTVICEGKEFISIKECSDFYNINLGTMKSWLSHNNKIPLEWYNKGLRFKGESMENYTVQIEELKGKNNSRTVICDNKEFINAKECSEYYNINYQTMTCWLNHNNKMPKKFYDMKLHYKDESMENYEYSKKYKLVICDNKIFESIQECADYYEIKFCTIQAWLSGRNKMPQKFVDLGLAYYD